MSDRPEKTRHKVRNRLLVSGAVVLLVCILALFSLHSYLSTPHAAFRLSRLLTSALGQPVRVGSIGFSGGVLLLENLSLDSPPGFTDRLVAVKRVEVEPFWSELLVGRRSFKRVALSGLRLHALRNGTGVWNFAELQRSLGTRKKPKTAGPELSIESLSLREGEILVNGQGVRNLNLQLSSLSSSGSRNAGVTVSFLDPGQSRWTISGKARGGTDSALDLALACQQFSLNRLLGQFGKRPVLLQEAPGALGVTVTKTGNLLRAAVRYELKQALLPGKLPLRATLSVGARYDLGRDEVRLDSLELSANDLVKLHASGILTEVRSARRFRVNLGVDDIDLSRAPLLPAAAGSGTALGGRVSGSAFRIAGNGAQGVTSLSGTLSLADLRLSREGKELVKGVGGDLRLESTGREVRLQGQLAGGSPGALLERLDGSFEAALSSKLKPLSVRVAHFGATITGIPLQGNFSYRRGEPDPLRLSLRVPPSPLRGVAPLLGRHDLQSLAGTLALSLELIGNSPTDLHGDGRLELASLLAVRGEQRLALGKGTATTRVLMRGGKPELSGDVRLNNAALAGTGGDAAFSYHLADRRLAFSRTTFSARGVSGSIGSLTLLIPPAVQQAMPLQVDLRDGIIRRGELALSGISGALNGTLISQKGKRSLEGNGRFELSQAAWHGRPVASMSAQVDVTSGRASGKMGGSLLGGSLASTLSLDSLTPDAKGTFDLALKEIGLAEAGGLMPAVKNAKLSGGRVELACNGTYSRAAGPAAHLQLDAREVSINDGSGKSLLTGGGVSLTGALAGQKAIVERAVLKAGVAAAMISGSMENAFSPRREGRFRLTLPPVPVNDLVDPFVGALPRMVQEATLGGTLGWSGELHLGDGERLFQGMLNLKGVGVDLESRQLHVADITGNVPVSLDLAGRNRGRTFETISFTRENYPRLLTRFRQARGAANLTVGDARIGPFDLGKVAVHTSAANGVTRIDQMRATLSGGSLFGSGAISIDRGISWRGDLLLQEVSLRLLCERFPAIKGYISGLMNGVISLDGGRGLAGLSGFTELWAGEGIGEKMLISREFLQKLSGKKLSGFFFRNDRAYDRAEILAILEQGYLTFEQLDIRHTNIFGVRDLSVSIAPSQNRIALDHLLTTVKQAATRGKQAAGSVSPAGDQEAPAAAPEFQWQE